ncbi:MAG: bifunctional pyr operon transcriptional regulator/uracil phosphoribosyltransferase PyrR [Solirubrobacteraceae bacterium]
MEREEKVVLHEEDIRRALTRIAHEIVERNDGDGVPALIGVHRRGAFLARRLHGLLEQLLDAELPLGDHDKGLYRHDVATRPDAPVLHASHIDFDMNGMTAVIVDDVLFTGRTARAAIEALFDYGRPQRIQLAVLADRGHRELPIRPDYVGKNLPTARGEHVHVRLTELDGVDEVAIAAARVGAEELRA